MTIETIGQLRAAIANLPDETPFAVFSGSMDSLVHSHCEVVAAGEFDAECATFMVFAEF